MNRPGFPGHLAAIIHGSNRGVYEQQAIHGRVQGRAVKQVTDRGHSVADVANRLGISIRSLYAWRRQYANPSATPAAIDQASELRRVKSELRRVTEERDILKKGRGVLCQAVRVKYAFMRDHEQEFRLRSMCRVFGLQPAGTTLGGARRCRRAPRMTRACSA